MIITIPIKPHLKKFLLKIYGQEPIKAEEDSVIGKHIMAILLDKRTSLHSNTNDQYTETIKVELSQPMYRRSPLVKKLVRINYFLQEDFKNALYIWVFGQVNAGINPYNATRNFVEHFNFDENEYTHDAAQRAWLRYKNEEYSRSKANRRLKEG